MKFDVIMGTCWAIGLAGFWTWLVARMADWDDPAKSITAGLIITGIWVLWVFLMAVIDKGEPD